MNIKIILPLMCIISVVYVVASSSKSYLTVNGNEFSYQIPIKYLKTSKSILYPGNIIGDKSKIISLLIPMNKFSPLTNKSNKVASVLIYLDKERSANKAFESFSKKVLEKKVLIDHMPPYYHFTEELGGSVKDIYLSFNPNNNSLKTISNKDYVVSMKQSEIFKIGKKSTVTTPMCNLEAYKDGMGMKFSFPNEVCKFDNFKKLKELQENFFENIKVSKLK